MLVGAQAGRNWKSSLTESLPPAPFTTSVSPLSSHVKSAPFISTNADIMTWVSSE